MEIKTTFRRYMRVLFIARKPGKDEFVNTSKISGLGIGVIGLIGFAIFLIFIFLLPSLGVPV